MDMFGRIGKDLVKNVDQIKHTGLDTGANVEYLSRSVRMLRCEQIRLPHVSNIDEVACLAAVTKYGDRFVIQQTADEDRHRRGVHGIRSLARAVDIEIAQRSHFQSELMGE